MRHWPLNFSLSLLQIEIVDSASSNTNQCFSRFYFGRWHFTVFKCLDTSSFFEKYCFHRLSFPNFVIGREINLIFWYAKRNAIALRFVILLFTCSIYVENFIAENYVVVSIVFIIYV